MFRMFKHVWLFPGDGGGEGTGSAAGTTVTITAPPTEEGQKTDPPAQGGEKTFTQAEVDKMIADRLARAQASSKPATDPPAQGGEAKPEIPPEFQQQLETMKKFTTLAEVKSQMAAAGVDPVKLERAGRLASLANCVGPDGMPDKAKIEAEVKSVMDEWPELKAAQTQGEAKKGFQIGSDGQGGTAATTEAELNKIFGLS